MLQLIVCTFEELGKAEEAKKAIQALDKQLDSVKLGNIAVLKKEGNGKFSFKETEEQAAVIQGTTIGLLSGMVVSVLFGPVALAAGAVAGSLAGSLPFITKLKDLGFPDRELKQLSDNLKAGSSALVTLLKPEEVGIVTAELEKQGGTFIQQQVSAELVQKLTAAAKNSDR